MNLQDIYRESAVARDFADVQKLAAHASRSDSERALLLASMEYAKVRETVWKVCAEICSRLEVLTDAVENVELALVPDDDGAKRPNEIGQNADAL